MTKNAKRDFFIAGGTLSPEAPSYVKRTADDEILDATIKGEYCYVLTSRQMGKSSLIIRTAQSLQSQGIRTAVIDLTQIGTVGIEKWYLGVLNQLSKRLSLKTSATAWWKEKYGLTEVQRFAEYIREVILVEITDSIVIFIDEIDTTLGYEFRDDFFSIIRSLHNERAITPALKKICFVLIGVATPQDLISDVTKTPFNIGQEIEILPFSLDEMNVFERGLKYTYSELEQSIIQRIHYWTNGHPFLTQKLCTYLVENQVDKLDSVYIDSTVETLFLSEKASRETNLQFVQNTILNHPKRKKLLSIYKNVLANKLVEEKKTPAYNHLKLSGLVIAKNGCLQVGNQIYKSIFNLEWVRKNTKLDYTKIVIPILSVIVLFFSVVFAYNYFVAAKATQAQLCVYNPSPPENTIRAQCLSALFKLKQVFPSKKYDVQARDLFWELPSLEEQKDIIDATRTGDIFPLAKGLYAALVDPENKNNTTELLVSLSVALEKEKQTLEVSNLQYEITYWLEAREAVSNGNYVQALENYNLALSYNNNNIATNYEIAHTLVHLGHYYDSLVRLDRIIEIAHLSDIHNNVETRPIKSYNNSLEFISRQAIRPQIQTENIVQAVDSLLSSDVHLLEVFVKSNPDVYKNLWEQTRFSYMLETITRQSNSDSEPIVSSTSVVSNSGSEDEGPHFFSQTKHNVQGAFWDYYQNVNEADKILGYPITEEFVNRDGVLVQYFKHARLEIQKDRVHVTPLGVLLYRPGVKLDIVNKSDCDIYGTGFSVCFAFRDYFNAHHGTGFLGLPISSFEFQDNMIVQYFQNGRLEWHPSNPDDQRVVTGNLGSAYFNAIGEDPARLTGVAPINGIITDAQVLSLNVRAFPWKPVVYTTDQQLIFVVVQDQTLQAVQGARGRAIVRWTSGTTLSLDILTDEKGIATLTLPVNNQAYGGLVTVDVDIAYGNSMGVTTTSFRIWY